MTLFFEVTYNTQAFTWWDNSTQPFVLSTGDPTGYGMHGDFLNGWDADTLQKAISDCTDDKPDCPDKTFTYWTPAEQQRWVVHGEPVEPARLIDTQLGYYAEHPDVVAGTLARERDRLRLLGLD